MANVKNGTNGKGQRFIEFIDLKDRECTIIEDGDKNSEPSISLGLATEGKSRVRLSQEQVKSILPFLKKFAEKGGLV